MVAEEDTEPEVVLVEIKKEALVLEVLAEEEIRLIGNLEMVAEVFVLFSIMYNSF